MATIPVEIVTTLDDLMRFEYLVAPGRILPDKPIYSILAGRHAARMRGRGLDFEEVRQYVAGDDVRTIDWRVTARSETTYSKVYNEEKERPTFVVLDQGPAMFFGSVRYVKSVTAAHVAALAAFYTLRRGDRFGGVVFGADGHDFVVPKRSKTLVQHFLQLTVERNAVLPRRKAVTTDSGLLPQMLERARTAITHDHVVMLVTNALQLDEPGIHTLQSLAVSNDVMVVHIEDPMDRTLPAGKLILTDGERQILWDNDRGGIGRKFTSDYDARIGALTDRLRRFRIPLAVLDTAMPVEQQISRNISQMLRR